MGRKAPKQPDLSNRLLQIDGDPIADRQSEDGKWRGMLNDRERKELAKRDLINRTIQLMMDGREMPDIGAELGQDASELATLLVYGDNKEARELFQNLVIDKMLDLTRDRTRVELATELGVTKKQLDRILRSDDFRELYSERFIQVRSDPNIEIVRQRVVEELLPKAYRALEQSLSPAAPWTVRQKAYADIFRMAGIEAIKPQSSDRAEAAKFLAEHNVIINVKEQNGPILAIPNEYEEALKKNMPPTEMVEGECRDVTEDQDQALQLPPASTPPSEPDRSEPANASST